MKNESASENGAEYSIPSNPHKEENIITEGISISTCLVRLSIIAILGLAVAWKKFGPIAENPFSGKHINHVCKNTAESDINSSSFVNIAEISVAQNLVIIHP